MMIASAYQCKRHNYSHDAFQQSMDHMFIENGIPPAKWPNWGTEFIDSLWPDEVTIPTPISETLSPINNPISFGSAMTRSDTCPPPEHLENSSEVTESNDNDQILGDDGESPNAPLTQLLFTSQDDISATFSNEILQHAPAANQSNQVKVIQLPITETPEIEQHAPTGTQSDQVVKLNSPTTIRENEILYDSLSGLDLPEGSQIGSLMNSQHPILHLESSQESIIDSSESSNSNNTQPSNNISLRSRIPPSATQQGKVFDPDYPEYWIRDKLHKYQGYPVIVLKRNGTKGKLWQHYFPEEKVTFTQLRDAIKDKVIGIPHFNEVTMKYINIAIEHELQDRYRLVKEVNLFNRDATKVITRTKSANYPKKD